MTENTNERDNKVEFERLALENEMDITSLNPDGSYADIEVLNGWLWFNDGVRFIAHKKNESVAYIRTDNSAVIANMQNTIDELRQQLAQQASVDALVEHLEAISGTEMNSMYSQKHKIQTMAKFVFDGLQAYEAMNEAKPKDVK